MHPVGPGITVGTDILALEVYDDGSGPALYAGGTFSSILGQAMGNIARWDGSAWSPLGSGVNGSVRALEVFDDGTGEGLYVGGVFNTAGGVFGHQRIARWDSSGWSGLAGGVHYGNLLPSVDSLIVFDDGTGLALYAGGGFTEAGGVQAARIAKWNGSAWSSLAGGVGDGASISLRVSALAVFDDGLGVALYVGGSFFSAGGQEANRIAKWNGSMWSPLGTGLNDDVFVLASFDDGSGAALYAGGEFTLAGDQAVSRVAKWDGSAWSSFGGVNSLPGGSHVEALQVFDDGAGAALFVGGTFWNSPGGDSNVAKFGCFEELGVAFCFGDGSGAACPCGNTGAAGGGCANGSGPGAVLSAGGSASTAAANLTLSGAQLSPGDTGLYFQGNSAVNGGLGVTFGDGLRCAGGGIVRLEVVSSTAAGTSSTTADIALAGGVAPGDTRTYQLWYRDTTGSPCGTGFNLTNGLELTWQP